MSPYMKTKFSFAEANSSLKKSVTFDMDDKLYNKWSQVNTSVNHAIIMTHIAGNNRKPKKGT